jgi:hypothetical protein
MNDLGMKLNPVMDRIPSERGSLRVLRMADDREVRRRADDLILMAHPDGDDRRKAIKEFPWLIDEELSPAIFAAI